MNIDLYMRDKKPDIGVVHVLTRFGMALILGCAMWTITALPIRIQSGS